MKKVLMIAYYFPPLATTGTYRTLKFVKYLREFNWEPVVLTVKNGFWWEDNNEELLKEIPKGVKVFRTHSFEITNILRRLFKKKTKSESSESDEQQNVDIKHKNSMIINIINFLIRVINSIFIPDITITWIPFSVHKGRNIILSENIDIIYSSGGPWTCHLIGFFLKKITKKPWVADFRDPWTDTRLDKCSKLRLKIEEFMEHYVLRAADKVISVSSPITERMSTKYPDVDKQKFSVITNGFDQDDFQNIKCGHFEKFTISYFGTFFRRRTSKFFLQAIQSLIEENKNLESEIEILFVGSCGKESLENLEILKLNKVVKLISTVSHQKCIEYMEKSNVLLLIIGTYAGAQGTYTGKLFEYLAAKRPILALVPEGVAYDLIKAAKAGFVVDPENIDAIKEMIYKLYLEYKQNTLRINPDMTVTEKFSRRNLTGDLVCIFNELSTERLNK